MSNYKARSLHETSADFSQSDTGAMEQAPAPSFASDEPISILLVDDEPRNLTALQSVLEDPGYRLVCAESADEALLALVVEEFALLVIDIQMPGMSGFELAQMIKQRKKTAGVPIIFLTAYYSEDRHVLEGYGSGAVDYLHKPINSTILRSKVDIFAELYRKNRESARANRALQIEVEARRRAEEQLLKLNDELELRVADRTAKLVEANTALIESQRRLGLALRAGHTGVWDWNFATNRVQWSEESCAILAIQPGTFEETIESFRQLVHHDDRERVFTKLYSAIDQREIYACQFRIVRLDGDERWVTILGVVQVESTGQPASMTGTITDVTERRAAEEALKNADRRKDEFLATLAHELRNPLAPLRTGLHILSASGDMAVAESTRKMMERQLSHMVRLIDDLLDVSRITSGKVTLRKEQVLLRTIVETAVEASRPIIEASGHALKINIPDDRVWFVADPTRFAQVITNLLTNAAKYTPEKGCIELMASHQCGEVIVSVSDTGLGIPPGMVDEVFEMFTQVNRTLERSQGGLGIGLALVRRIVEFHGGTITAESPGLGKGSTFTIRLPLIQSCVGRNEEQSTAKIPSVLPESCACRVLVVDDNVDGAESLAKMLQINGHEVQTAHSGLSALEVAYRFHPNVVFLDIGLPEISGYDVARRLRAEPTLRGAVLVALTGWGSDDDKRQSKEAGFDFHLTKPVEFPDIVHLLTRASGQAS
jgi:signal transduction histidine kinase